MLLSNLGAKVHSFFVGMKKYFFIFLQKIMNDKTT